MLAARRAAAQLGRFASPSTSRAFSTGMAVRRDFVQDLYLRELKAYKPKEVSANAHVGQVKEFHSPSAPQAPVVPSGADLAKELEAYEREEVGAAPGSTSSSSTSSSSAEESEISSNAQTADEYISFVEQEARRQPSPDGHH